MKLKIDQYGALLEYTPYTDAKFKDGLVLSSSSPKIRASWILVWDPSKSIISLWMCCTSSSNLDQGYRFLKDLPIARFWCCDFTFYLLLHSHCLQALFFQVVCAQVDTCGAVIELCWPRSHFFHLQNRNKHDFLWGVLSVLLQSIR